MARHKHTRRSHTDRPAPLPDKHITVQVVRHNVGWSRQRVVASRQVIVNAQHTVQQAVLDMYKLPGESNAVVLRRAGTPGASIWWDLPYGHRRFLEDWYPQIQDGDVVLICILYDEDQDVFPGPGERFPQRDIAGPGHYERRPAAPTHGPHHHHCRWMHCNLAALLSLE